MTVITRLTVFKQKLQELGWPEGPNLQVEVRWTAGDADHVRRYSTELVTIAPDVILAVGSPNVAAMQLASRSLPIVFVSVVDPVGVGFVDNLARPDRTPQYRRAARRRRGVASACWYRCRCRHARRPRRQTAAPQHGPGVSSVSSVVTTIGRLRRSGGFERGTITNRKRWRGPPLPPRERPLCFPRQPAFAAMSKSPSSPKSGYSAASNPTLQRAELALQMRQLGEAEQLASQIFKANRSNVDAALLLARALMMQNRVDEAIPTLQRAARRGDDARVETLLGAALAGVGRREEALELLRKIGTMDSRSSSRPTGRAQLARKTCGSPHERLSATPG